jgi:hypothetical protein
MQGAKNGSRKNDDVPDAMEDDVPDATEDVSEKPKKKRKQTPVGPTDGTTHTSSHTKRVPRKMTESSSNNP